MIVASTADEIRKQVREWRVSGLTVALVPTMGALHEGHLSLVRTASKVADKVVVSIFVNPTQFGPNEDFDRYPRTFDADLQQLSNLQCDAIYAPTASQMYKPGFQTSVELAHLPQHLCGLGRPVHFGGVALVVSKLFIACEPDFAVFGEKDFQQVRVIEQMVSDLDFAVKIVRSPTVREPDGLALSSRNRYLSQEQRVAAPVLYETLVNMAKSIEAGASDPKALIEHGIKLISAKGLEVEYLSIVDPIDLEDVELVTGPVRILVAARLGATRLIDNIAA
ncbi:MAG TPA: pantoate--beta-alanine ligase [Myxococcota bacterium]|nr:pantoate--beta-alanine ligase [Myxococcota bacterium]HON25441.1 pantoate--beta-alanine ligase [Myxococcota bacterium]HOS61955.1 pantoate--beta-alanine ligase [Myxococcota bacterium]HPL25034.1 pantoate--beta-alanine ligase [Myxococcota bacterium]HQE73390.1 pantoate--beta-alanine ligase [Myxococcota bacterium]